MFWKLNDENSTFKRFFQLDHKSQILRVFDKETTFKCKMSDMKIPIGKQA